MISQEMAIKLSASLGAKQAKLIYPTQNFVDLVWKTKPARSQDPIWVHGTEFAGTYHLNTDHKAPFANLYV